MTGDRMPVRILTLQTIANVDDDLCCSLGLDERHRSIGLISTDCDDATYIALDEATKAAAVDVVFARSLYAGAANASTRLAGEVIGILGGANPSEVRSGLLAAARFLQAGAAFRSANADDTVVYLAHCIGSTGSYLSKLARIPRGQALAYLIAPPVEAIVALDAALKAADVRMAEFYAPPTETNFAGALLTGSQSACFAACEAFSGAVCAVAQTPQAIGGKELGIG